MLQWSWCLKLIISSGYAWGSLLCFFVRCYEQWTITFFTLHGCWELKLRYCLGKVGLQYTDDRNSCCMHRFNKGRGSKFYVGSWIQQIPEENWRTYWLNCCEYDNKDEDNNPKTLNDINHQALSQKFRQLILRVLAIKIASKAWSTALESMVLVLTSLAWSSRFLPTPSNFLNHLVTVVWSSASSSFAQQRVLIVMAQFKLVKCKFLN